MIHPFCLSQKKKMESVNATITIKEIESLFLNLLAAMKAPVLKG